MYASAGAQLAFHMLILQKMHYAVNTIVNGGLRRCKGQLMRNGTITMDGKISI